MIQVILKDGTKKRFTKRVIGIDPNDIAYQKELTSEEIGKIPDVVNNKLVMRDRNQSEINEANAKKQLEVDKKNILKKIEDKKADMAIQSLLGSGDITQADVDKLA